MARECAENAESGREKGDGEKGEGVQGADVSVATVSDDCQVLTEPSGLSSLST